MWTFKNKNVFHILKHSSLNEELHFLKFYKSNKKIFRVEYALCRVRNLLEILCSYFNHKHKLHKRISMNKLQINKIELTAKKVKFWFIIIAILKN